MRSELRTEIIRNFVAALTVSFIALSLGAAFGLLSGRGAMAGMLSSAIIASITSLLGGTRIQCSGPTGPMTTVMALLVAASSDRLVAAFPDVAADQIINLTLMVTAGVLLIAAVIRLGYFISWIPNVVISGFMNGIAVIIWMDQIRLLTGIGGKKALAGPFAANLAVVILTVCLVFLIPVVARRYLSRMASLLSGTFLAIVIMTVACSILNVGIERVVLTGTLKNWSDFANLVSSQIPTHWSAPLVWAVLPFALQLAVLAYLDTLMTALVIDKMTGTKTRPNQELAAQGIAMAGVACIGGIAGAQATIRSVVMVKEGATFRWAGVLVGILAILEMVLFQDWIAMIPKAVFAGVLIKVGYDVFDWMPLRIYFRQLFRKKTGESSVGGPAINVRTIEVVLILSTAAVTVLWDLNIAVGLFTAVFYLWNRVLFRNNPIPDLVKDSETESFSDEP